MVLHSTLEAVDAQLQRATCPEDVFGTDPKTTFKRLAVSVFPDHADPSDKDYATQVAARLSELRGEAEAKIAAGTYGDRKPYKDKSSYTPFTVTTGKYEITLEDLIATGTVSTIHQTSLKGDKTGAMFFTKVARTPSNNDLLEAEFRNLQVITKRDPDPEKEKWFKGWRVYVPYPVSSFSFVGEKGEKRKANLLTIPPYKSYTGEELRSIFKDGVDPNHVYWIYRRLLLTAWMAHVRGRNHGAITPDHVLIYPKEHGLVLLDWTASTVLGKEHTPIRDAKWKDLLPPELKDKKPTSTTSDIYTCSSFALYLLGSQKVPPQIKSFLEKCTCANPQSRPDDAEVVYTEFGTLLERVNGKRKFVELVIP